MTITETTFTPADPVKAFHIASGLQDDILRLKDAPMSLRTIAEANDMEDDYRGAILSTARYIEAELETIEGKAGTIFHLLHGCAYPERHNGEGGAS